MIANERHSRLTPTVLAQLTVEWLGATPVVWTGTKRAAIALDPADAATITWIAYQADSVHDPAACAACVWDCCQITGPSDFFDDAALGRIDGTVLILHAVMLRVESLPLSAVAPFHVLTEAKLDEQWRHAGQRRERQTSTATDWWDSYVADHWSPRLWAAIATARELAKRADRVDHPSMR